MFRKKFRLSDAARIWIFIAAAIVFLQFAVNVLRSVDTDVGVSLLLVIDITMTAFALLVTLYAVVGRRLGSYRVVVLRHENEMSKGKIYRTATLGEIFQVASSFAWRAMLIEIPVILAFLPLFLPNACLTNVVDAVISHPSGIGGLWYRLCLSLSTIAETWGGINFPIAVSLLQLVLLPVLRTVLNQDFGSFQLALEKCESRNANV